MVAGHHFDVPRRRFQRAHARRPHLTTRQKQARGHGVLGLSGWTTATPGAAAAARLAHARVSVAPPWPACSLGRFATRTGEAAREPTVDANIPLRHAGLDLIGEVRPVAAGCRFVARLADEANICLRQLDDAELVRIHRCRELDVRRPRTARPLRAAHPAWVQDLGDRSSDAPVRLVDCPFDRLTRRLPRVAPGRSAVRPSESLCAVPFAVLAVFPPRLTAWRAVLPAP